MNHLGELAAVSTSLSWTLCSLGFAAATRRVGALAVNQIRIVAAVAVLLVAHRVFAGVWWPAFGGEAHGLLVASGLLGLTLGDWCYFHCIGTLGPRLGTLLMATWPVPCALLAWPVLGEGLGPGALLGMAMVLGGVALVLMRGQRDRGWGPPIEARALRWAVAAGLLGAVGQASGLVLAKLAMRGLPDGAADAASTPLQATLVRMAAAGVGAALLVVGARRARVVGGALRDRRAMSATLVGVLFGPTLGVWLSLVAVQHAAAGVAAALMSLPPIFMLPIAWRYHGARLGVAAVGGTVLAVAGAAVLFLAP